MRIVSGRWAGHALTSPGGRVRPTAEGVREVAAELALETLGALEPDPAATGGPRLADLFAGTGAVGLEILSRLLQGGPPRSPAPQPGSPGGRRRPHLDLVETDPAALHALKANARALAAVGGKARGGAPSIRVLERDAIAWVEAPRHRPWVLAYADPPWGSGKVERLLRAWSGRPFARALLLEHATDHALPSALLRARQAHRRLGDASLSLFLAPPLPSPLPAARARDGRGGTGPEAHAGTDRAETEGQEGMDP